MTFALRALPSIAGLSLASTSLPTAAQPPAQYVLISFDGAHDIARWKRSRALGENTGARFTYFLSCVFLLSPETRGEYRAPAAESSRSNVGFAKSKADVAERLEQIWMARGEGHEIASHGCGHFDGKNWSKADWRAEFAAFSRVLQDAWRINAIEAEPVGWRQSWQDAVVGFRAPYLSVGAGLDAALREAGFAYDASGVSQHPVQPADNNGVAYFALPLIAEGPAGRRVLAMDYNLYVRHSAGLERPSQAAAFEERAYRAFTTAFDEQYRGARAPLQIGFHFTLMNGGAYWRALERFAEDVCVKPDVACVSYHDYLQARPRGGAGPVMEVGG
jgi:peptidoglycan/xylan/chitin deacetylase (PgdA/CDA1 family)